MKQIFNLWASKLQNEQRSNKVTLLRREIVSTFYSWIRLKLPNEVLESLGVECPELFQMVFEELKSDDIDSLEIAADCVVELL